MDIISVFKDIAIKTKEPLEIIIVGAQSITMDIDAEVIRGDVEKLNTSK
ncbi:hypothetical protein HY04AAS1_1600 [Hydrogenobaculum sp. Y04AAS1]|nr:hypothetical protein HY04AAS1_1600 [Hydrogenobaculum sp. Y04AAS1]